jgi:uncharacterized protein YbcI
MASWRATRPVPASGTRLTDPEATDVPRIPDPHREHPTNRQVASAISTAVVHALGEYTGRGPTKARTYVNHDVITVLLRDTLTKAERRLVSDGNAPAVLQTREIFQQMMREELVASVEDLTGRTVMAFMSANHIDPDVDVETFVLEPEPEATRAPEPGPMPSS